MKEFFFLLADVKVKTENKSDIDGWISSMVAGLADRLKYNSSR